MHRTLIATNPLAGLRTPPVSRKPVGGLLSAQEPSPHISTVDLPLPVLVGRRPHAALCSPLYAGVMEVVIMVAVLVLIAVALGVARDRSLSRRIGREVRKEHGDET